MSRKLIGVLTVVSVAGNILLAFCLAKSWHSRATSLIANPNSESEPAALKEALDSRRTASPKEHADELPEFRWTQLESTNFVEYANNLRQAGFPEMVVRDALIPQIIGAYRRLLRGHARFALAPRWANVPGSVLRQHRDEWDRLKGQERELMRSLFDVDLNRLGFYQPWEFNVRQEEFPFLDDQLRDRLSSLKRERSGARAALLGRGLAGAELDAGLEPLVRRQEEELRAVLPPEVFERLAR
jgi:hypothetical protein